MDTFELTGATKQQRDTLKDRGFTLEIIESDIWNVSSPEDRTDELTDYLDAQLILYRMV